MKKYVIVNYYNNIEFVLYDSSKNGKIYWKLMKDLFYVKVMYNKNIFIVIF